MGRLKHMECDDVLVTIPKKIRHDNKKSCVHTRHGYCWEQRVRTEDVSGWNACVEYMRGLVKSEVGASKGASWQDVVELVKAAVPDELEALEKRMAEGKE